MYVTWDNFVHKKSDWFFVIIVVLQLMMIVDL